jgi:hypothetical protein
VRNYLLSAAELIGVLFIVACIDLLAIAVGG